MAADERDEMRDMEPAAGVAGEGGVAGPGGGAGAEAADSSVPEVAMPTAELPVVDITKLPRIQDDPGKYGPKGASERRPKRASEIAKPGIACPSCGKTIAPGDWFCRSCGTVIAPHDSAKLSAKDVSTGRATSGASDGAFRPAASQGSVGRHARVAGSSAGAAAGTWAEHRVGTGSGAGYGAGIGSGSGSAYGAASPGEGALRRGRHASPMASAAGTPAAVSSGAPGTLRAGNVSPHYEPDPEPSPVPRILAGLAAVALALGVGWWVGGKRLPTLPWLPGSQAGEPGIAAGSAEDPGTSTDGPGTGQGSAAGDTGDPVEPAGPAEAELSYELVSEALSWDEAEEWCEEHGGTLAQPRTAEQLAEVLALVDESDAWIAWVGGMRDGDESGSASGRGSGFSWVDGDAVDEALFVPGEPNDLEGIEDRLAILRADDGCGLFDVPSDLRADYPADVFAFVIERPAA